MIRVSARNARFQEWAALLTNRNKRQRAGEFLVQGVRPITRAVERRWTVRALAYPAGERLSDWAAGVLRTAGGERAELAPELFAELAEKDAGELVAVVAMPPDELDRVPLGVPGSPVVVFDRPTGPGNIGTVIRSADAFGASGLVVTGHAADVYDPRAVRASTGSLFALPVVRRESAAEVIDWARTRDVRIVGTDERAALDVAAADLTRPCLIVIGNETRGMSRAWHDACDLVAAIPISGSASSLNAAEAASVTLYEAARQRGVARGSA